MCRSMTGHEITRARHVVVVVAEAFEQRATRDLEILRVVAVPDDAHGIEIVERHLDGNDVGAEVVLGVH